MKKQKPHNQNSLIYWSIAIALAFALGSCHSEQKALRKTQEYLFSHPDFSAGYCAEQYPVKDSIITRDSVRYDTLYVQWPEEPGDSTTPFEVSPEQPTAISPSGGGGKVITRYITKTIRKDSIIYKRDMAEERRLNLSLQACQGNNNNLINKNDGLQQQLNEWKGKAKARWWWIITIIAAGATYTVIKFKKNILSLKNRLT